MGIVILFAVVGVIATVIWTLNRVRDSIEVKKWRRIVKEWNEESLIPSLRSLREMKNDAGGLRESLRQMSQKTEKKDLLGIVEKYITLVGNTIKEVEKLSDKADALKM